MTSILLLQRPLGVDLTEEGKLKWTILIVSEWIILAPEVCWRVAFK